MHKIDNHSLLTELPKGNEKVLVTMKGGKTIECTYDRGINKFTYEAIDRVTKSKALIVVNSDEIFGWQLIEKKSKAEKVLDEEAHLKNQEELEKALLEEGDDKQEQI